MPIDRDPESERRARIDRLIEEIRRQPGSLVEKGLLKPEKAPVSRPPKARRHPKKSA